MHCSELNIKHKICGYSAYLFSVYMTLVEYPGSEMHKKVYILIFKRWNE